VVEPASCLCGRQASCLVTFVVRLHRPRTRRSAMATPDDYADAAEATPRLVADDEATGTASGEKVKTTDKAKARSQTGGGVGV